MTLRGRVRDMNIIRKGRKTESESKEAQIETEHQWSATKQHVTQIWQWNKTEREVGGDDMFSAASHAVIIHELRSVIPMS